MIWGLVAVLVWLAFVIHWVLSPEAQYEGLEKIVRDFDEDDCNPPRPMTGFLATLTEEQKKAALAYRGDEF